MKKFLVTWGLLAAAATCAAALTFVYWSGIPFTPHTRASELGQLGDFFGGLLNPVVSALTLFVAISVWRLQKDELELTRNELAQTKFVMEEQAKTSEQQRAEARFFDLLNLYQLTIASISKPVEGGHHSNSTAASFGMAASAAYATVVSGRSAFQHLFTYSINRYFKGGRLEDNFDNSDGDWKTAKDCWQDESQQIDHYFRTVFMVPREAEATLGQAHHYRYVKMFRAQLSREELALLAFNMLLDPEGQKMQQVAAKYGILKHLPKNLLRQKVEGKLNPKVFGRGFVHRQLSLNDTQGAPA